MATTAHKFVKLTQESDAGTREPPVALGSVVYYQLRAPSFPSLPLEVIVDEFAGRFCKVWPGNHLLELLYASRALRDGHGDKACPNAQVEMVYALKALVSSANLITADHEHSIETWLLTADKAFVRNGTPQSQPPDEARAL